MAVHFPELFSGCTSCALIDENNALSTASFQNGRADFHNASVTLEETADGTAVSLAAPGTPVSWVILRFPGTFPAGTLFYGDSNKNPDEFNGLAMRYPSKTSPNVVNAAGSSANKQTSMYLISWGGNSIHGIYPKGSTGGLKNEDLGKYMTFDDAGKKFQCVGDLYTWKCGLALRDWRAVVRICNLDTSKLTLRKGESGFIYLQALTIKAKNMMPQHLRDRAVWYCNQDVLTALELQATDAGNVHLVYGEFFASKAVPNLHGRPIRQCDAILSTEAVLS